MTGARLCRLAVVLALLSGCSRGTDEALQPPGEPEAAGDQPTASQTVDAELPDEPTLVSLDELLPKDFALLTKPWTGDLDGMIERRVIRILVISGGPQFFYLEGRPRGIVTELLVMLQRELNAGLGRRHDQVEIVPMPVSRDRLIPALLEGQADLVATDLTVTETRSELVDFSDPLVTGIDEVVVFAPGVGRSTGDLDDLAGQAVYVRRSSSYFEHLTALNQDFAARGLEPVRIVEVDELLRAQDILEMVNAGSFPATVIDSYKASYWSKVLTDMVVRDDLVVHEGGQIAWAFRKDSPKLKAVVNEFVAGHKAGTLVGNVLIRRYLQNAGWVRNATSASANERLAELFEHFTRSGEAYDLDPFMLAAQAFQESEFDHGRVSPAGAVGIMQIKPSTAADRNVGIQDISTIEANVEAASKYLRFLIDRYFADEGIEPMQRWMFALAAYNAGPARIRQLRQQAEREGLDPDRWTDNVELLASRRIGAEPVRYVRNILKYYIAYRLAFESYRMRQEDGTLPGAEQSRRFDRADRAGTLKTAAHRRLKRTSGPGI